MPENKSFNPFEQHINSELFDVSTLASYQKRSPLEIEVDNFVEDLPKNLTVELDKHQQIISERVAAHLRKNLEQDESLHVIADLSEEELARLLALPIAMGMLAQERLNTPEPPPPPVETPQRPVYQSEYGELPTNWGDILNDWAMQLKDFVIKLFRRN